MYSQYPNPYQPAPSPTAFDEQKNLKLKQLQVDSILKRFPNARIVSFDKSTIDIPVIFKGNNQVTFRINLPPTFPQQPPLVTLLARCQPGYALLKDNYSVVQHADITTQWGGHKNLGDVLASIFSEFQHNPPKIISYSPPPPMPPQTQPPSAFPVPPTQTPPNPSPTNVIESKPLPPKPQIQIPNIPSTFPEVEKLSPQEAQQLLAAAEDDWRFKEFFESLEYVKNLDGIWKAIRDENVEMASFVFLVFFESFNVYKYQTEKNIARDEELSKKYEVNKELNQKLGDLMKRYDDRLKEQQEITQRYSPKVLLGILKKAVDQSEMESDEIGEEFLRNGNKDNMKEFIQKFMEKRQLMHLRKAKKERLEKNFTQ